MGRLPAAYCRVLLAYACLGILLWTTPLLSILHVESSAIVATAAFFAAGVSSLSMYKRGAGFRRALLLQEAALLIPWSLLTVSAVWQPNCGYVQGILFYVIFPGVTVVFAVSMARLLDALPIRRKASILVLVGVLLIVVPPVFDIGFHPQFYSYNHVFGGFLGPIYDEELAIRPGLFVFRALTLLISMMMLMGVRVVKRSSGGLILGAMAVVVVLCYAFSPALGFITTYQQIRDALGSVHQTEHFDIYYDAESIDDEEILNLADEHEYRFTILQDRLRLTVEGRIQSYIYPSPDTKARLTGARYTNVAPVWLETPQTHVLLTEFERVFSHELVHVFSREFGHPLLNASVSVGLVEGLAVALEAPDGLPGPHEQVSGMLLDVSSNNDGPTRDLPTSMASHLSPVGFWTGRGAVSYTMMGSFVRFLIDAYGPELFKQVYARGNFVEVYGKNVEGLAREWVQMLLRRDVVDRSAASFAAARFAVPSLFEKDCPHFVPRYRRTYEAAVGALAAGDSSRAIQLADASYRQEADFLSALDFWATLKLARGDAGEVLERLRSAPREPTSAALHVRWGDAYALLGRSEDAKDHYNAALDRLPSFAHESVSMVLLRVAAADHPASIRYLLTGVSASDSRSDAIGQVASAIHQAKAGRYEQAVELLRTTPIKALESSVQRLGDELTRRRFVWTSRFAYRAGMLDEAALYADSAAVAYRRVGAYNEAVLQHDFRDKMVWIASRRLDNVAAAVERFTNGNRTDGQSDRTGDSP